MEVFFVPPIFFGGGVGSGEGGDIRRCRESSRVELKLRWWKSLCIPGRVVRVPSYGSGGLVGMVVPFCFLDLEQRGSGRADVELTK